MELRTKYFTFTTNKTPDYLNPPVVPTPLATKVAKLGNHVATETRTNLKQGLLTIASKL